MRFVRYHGTTHAEWGLLQADGGRVQVLEGDPLAGYTATRRFVDLLDLKVLAPATPTKIVAVGLNYAAHAAESSKPLPEEPLLFLKPPSSINANNGPIHVPFPHHRTDFEAELGVVIGRKCRHLQPSTWRDAVLGYTCANDVTDRTLQRKDGQYTRGKGFDTFCPLGPVLATEIDPDHLEIECRVNGRLRQHSHTSDLIFDVCAVLCFVSSIMTLEPWDVVLTGTPSGVGPLSDGDMVEVKIEGVGTLVNPVCSWQGGGHEARQ